MYCLILCFEQVVVGVYGQWDAAVLHYLGTFAVDQRHLRGTGGS